ncbi:hypothetical protein [Bacillus toyonensis]|uniref:hypothetical protein n=1 Tax=Bacillus toyonensis TaxID=155322 RepID=UPI00027BEAB8|nr:hypothetical protein [Bacillus toyonensis]EJV41792.1 hypothetical protein IEA_05677 [Bacillus toyonensis]
MYKIAIVSEKVSFELHEDEETTFGMAETFRIAKRDGKNAVFNFYCHYNKQQVIIGVEQVQFISYKPMEGNEDEKKTQG